ncbi:MAG: hypothetical protein ACLRFJ_03395 [Alphaproteobacteria bacterium]
MKKLSIIPIILLCCGTAFGDIASTEYVNSEKTKLESAISSKAPGTGTPSRAMITSDSGSATSGQISGSMMADGSITTDKLANGSVDNNAIADGAIGLKKLSLTFPTSGKHLLTWDNASNSYKFEAIKIPLQCSAGTYDIGFDQCIDLATNGSAYGYRSDSTGAYGLESSNTDVYGLTTDQTWGVTFDGYGNVKGITSCNSTSGDNADYTWSNNSSNWLKPGNTFTQDSQGQYCWCKMTLPSASGWVFLLDARGNADDCASNCASNCANGVQGDFGFRSAVVSAVGN